MKADSPSSSPRFTNLVPLRVRFGPLLRWFFLGFFLFAEIFLATRLWNGWQIQAIGRLLAVQIFFAPRLLFAGFAFSAFATVMAERMVRWIARPLSTKWLKPSTGLPLESELPLHMRVGEAIELATTGRRKTENKWEPGWLIISTERMFWLSGVWRMTAWEIERTTLDIPLTARLSLADGPRWLGGFVVGMPPRLIVHLSPTAYAEDEHQETIALADLEAIFQHLDPESYLVAEPTDPEPLIAPPSQPVQLSDRPSPLEVRGVILPPRRVVQQKVRPEMVKPPLRPVSKQDPLEVRGVMLPPRRKKS